MSIIAINVDTTGLVGSTIQPRRCTMITTDNLSTITTAGYLNNQNTSGKPIFPTDVFEVLYSFNEATQVGTLGFFQVTFSSSTGFTLNIWENPGNVLLPVTSNAIAVFNGTNGQIKSNTTASPATATNNGGLQAGASGTAGTVASFPATAANGSLILAAINAGGAFNTTLSNSTMGQSTVYSLADIGASTGGIPVSTAAIRMKSVAGAAAAGGAAAQSFTDAFCTSGSNVIGNWNTQANAASILKIVPGNGSFIVTSSVDAGVGTFNYVIMK